MKRLDLNFKKGGKAVLAAFSATSAPGEGFTFQCIIRESRKRACPPVGELHLKLERFSFLTGAEFLRERRNSGGFLRSPKKGCLQTFEDLLQKYAKVSAPPKCPCQNFTPITRQQSSLKGCGKTFFQESFPASPVVRIFFCSHHIFHTKGRNHNEKI